MTDGIDIWVKPTPEDIGQFVNLEEHPEIAEILRDLKDALRELDAIDDDGYRARQEIEYVHREIKKIEKRLTIEFQRIIQNARYRIRSSIAV